MTLGGLVGLRVRALVHLGLVALGLSATKVLLYAVSNALFLTRAGVEQLPVFYLIFAGIAIVLSLALATIVDRMPSTQLLRRTMLVVIVGTAAVRLLSGHGSSWLYFALLAGAHVYDIVSDILLWVAAAARLSSADYKRGTPVICLCLAVGGALGGIAADRLSVHLPPEDVLVLSAAIAAGVLALLAAADRSFGVLPLQAPELSAQEGLASTLAFLPQLAFRQPLVLMLALGSLMLTLVYGLTEYLCFQVYDRSFASESELAGFLAAVFAVIQVVEFLLLATFSRTLVHRVGPVVRNMLFPCTSLVCLGAFAVDTRLPVAVAAHINTEAFSNALHEPVAAANYTALPVQVHGRARTLADGIFYPSGLAIAGAVLLFAGDQGISAVTLAIAMLFAIVFVAVGAGTGALFLPTLVSNLRLRPGGADNLALAARHPAGIGTHLRGWLAPRRRGHEAIALEQLRTAALEDGLRRILGEGVPSASDIDELLRTCRADAGRAAVATALTQDDRRALIAVLSGSLPGARPRRMLAGLALLASLDAHREPDAAALAGDLATHTDLRIRIAAAALTRGSVRRQARAAIRHMLPLVHEPAADIHRWLTSIPRDDDRWEPLRSAILDRARRAVAVVLYALAVLGDGRMVRRIARSLDADDPQERADALEALRTLPHRQVWAPVVPLIEHMAEPASEGSAARNRSPPPATVLREAAGAADRWIRAGAASTARTLGESHAFRARGESGTTTTSEERTMEQILFLKRIPIFRYLPLDAVAEIARGLNRRSYRAGELIVEAGTRLEHLHIVEDGIVETRGANGSRAELAPPSCFGEAALVDAAAAAPRVVARSDCTLLLLHRIVFEDVAEEHPELFRELSRQLARSLRPDAAAATAGA